MSFDHGPKIYLRGAVSNILIYGGYGHRSPLEGKVDLCDYHFGFYTVRNMLHVVRIQFVFSSIEHV